MKSVKLKYKKIYSVNFLILLVIIVLSFALRFYHLGKIPNGLSPDEADQGYNAFSILKTGRDVYGYKLPLTFKSFDDYKPAIPVYLTIPSLIIFKNTDIAIKFMPALLGSITPLLFFFLLKLLYKKDLLLPHLGALMLAVSPWNIAISRGEVALIEFVLIFLAFFIFLFLALSKNIKFLFAEKLCLYLAAFTAGISLYVYYASSIYIPIIALIAAAIYKDTILKNIKTVLICTLLFSIMAVPLANSYINGKGANRLNKISIFTPDITLPLSISEMRFDQSQKIPFSSVFHNRRFVYLQTMLDNYFDYFNLGYLFSNSIRTRYFYVTYVGLFYLVELPFFIYGLFVFARRRQKSDVFLLQLLLVSPVPAIITLGSSFPNRALLLPLTIQVISAYGLYTFMSNFNKKKVKTKYIAIASIGAIYIFDFLFFAHQYFIHSPREYSSELNNGSWFSTVKTVMPIVLANREKYDKIVFTWSRLKLAPAVYFYYYNKTDPRILQNKAAKWTNEPPLFTQIYNQWENIEFRQIDWKTDKNLKNTLFIGYDEEFPKDVDGVIARTYLPGGSVQFKVVSTAQSTPP